MFAIILDSIADGAFTVDLDFKITFVNRAAERITGFSAEEAVGQRCYNIFRSSVCQGGCVLKHTMDTGESVSGMEITVLDRKNREVPISVSTALLKDKEGKIIGGVETFRDLSEVVALRNAMRRSYQLGDLVSKNHRMQEIFALVPDIARSNASVMILGETGAGKEVLARAIHGEGPRADGPFVPVSCAALPDSLLEAELFGYKAGAFTDARQDRKGRFAQAHKGTIFLDEVGDLSEAIQVKLLRAIEEKKIEPLGADRPESVDVRVISATHRDPRDMVRKGKFRKDLFFRLNTVVIEIPPLRERREDTPLLVDAFVKQFNLESGKSVSSIAPEAMSIIMSYPWPGNVRELKHVIEHAFVLVKGRTIRAEHLPTEIIRAGREALSGHSIREDELVGAPTSLCPPDLQSIRPESNEDTEAGGGLSPLERAEKDTLIRVLSKHNWKREEAARELGMSRATLWRKMKRLSIAAPRRREVS